MNKLHYIKDETCYEQEGNATRKVGKSGATHVADGVYGGKDGYTITYDSGQVYMTCGNVTSEIRGGCSGKIISTQYYNDGIILNYENGERYFAYKGGGRKL